MVVDENNTIQALLQSIQAIPVGVDHAIVSEWQARQQAIHIAALQYKIVHNDGPSDPSDSVFMELADFLIQKATWYSVRI